MEKTLSVVAIVVLNTGIDPQLFNAYWLVKNGILHEEELALDHVFTKHFVQLNLEKCDILINGNSFQFSLKNNYLDNFDYLLDRAKRLIEATKNTIFVGAGINFNWILNLEHGRYRKLSKELFYKEESSIYTNFKGEDACFGAYMSKNFLKSRLKLDIKPFLINNLDFDNGSLNFNFNFHLDLVEENRVKVLHDYIKSWQEYYNESNKIINSF